MIKKLFIENFILIDNLEINFDKGLTVLIGETGAGKSLIISSIESLLGGKTNYDCIGNYKDYSYIEGVFLLNDNAKRFLKENDFDEFDNEVIISKTIRKSSSKYRINGILVNNNLVKKLSENIIDIIGQHENQYLFKSEKHIHFLDSLGDEEHKILLEELKSLYNKIISLKKEHDFLCKEILENKRLLDFYKFQLNEIVEANLKLNEDLELKEEREILVNSQEIITILSKAYNNIYSSNEYSIIDSLSKLTKEIYSISKFSSDIEKICIELDNITDNLKEISRSIRFKLESIETNPNRLIEVEDRLNIINNLKKKYGNTIEEILNFSVDLKNKLLLIESSDEKIDNLYKEITNLENEYALLAKKLSKNRKNIAKKLEKEILNEFKELAMENILFKVNFLEKSSSENGIDDIEFLIRTNVGDDLKALSKIASGGEVSRIMLALQIVINKNNNVSTLIFDEIDTGISGKASLNVSKKLNKLSLNNQVICITHLPIVAAMADNHFWIEKHLINNTTKINVTKLNNQNKIEKIANMSSGIINDKTLKYAKEICLKAEDYKKSLLEFTFSK